MRAWYHLIAALLGLALAALLVTVAFREADQSGSAQSGSPGATQAARGSGSGGANADCARSTPAAGRKPKAIAEAETGLPQIFDGAGVQREVRSSTQRRWFGRLQSFGGNCVDEVVVAERTLTVTMTFPASVPAKTRDGYLIGAINASFQAPLARRALTVNWAAGESTGSVAIRSGAWTQFQQSRRALGLDETMAGLQRYGRRVGLGPQELLIK